MSAEKENSMAKQVWKGGALLAPLPAVLVTTGDMVHADVATVAWTGIVNTQPPKTYISLRKSRYSYELLEKSGECVINLTTAEMARKVDYCGIYTGRKVDKFAKCGFTKTAASAVAAPLIAESPLSLECRVRQKLPLGSHTMFLADILSVDVDEKLLDRDGKLCLERAGLLAFAHGAYYALGRELGTFGFSVRKKRTRPGINSARHGKRG